MQPLDLTTRSPALPAFSGVRSGRSSCLAMTDKQRVSVCEAIGEPELGADARYARALIASNVGTKSFK
jgi:hypothetical protein